MTVIAVSTRSGLVECEHHGHVIVTDPLGASVLSIGRPEHITYPRSANKLLQSAAMVALGLKLPASLLALSASSHSGEDFHQHHVEELLTIAGRTVRDLNNTPSLPIDQKAAHAVMRAGGSETRLAQNCSGKHAAMIATCVVRGWPVDGYLQLDHPLQGAITDALGAAVGEPALHVGIDGCGAPTHAYPLIGLARAFGSSRVGESPANQVAEAMLRFPELVGGTRRDVTLLMQALPGVLVKDGADGVMAASLADGTGIALKIGDGAALPRVAVLLSVLEHLGYSVDAAREAVPLPVWGHGRPVGEIRSTLPWES